MLSCPNKNDPRWKQMVDALGEDEAYYYFNLNQGFMSGEGMSEVQTFDIEKQYSENEFPKELESEIPLEVWNSLSPEEQTKIINCL